jgi:hypothetical protein
VAHGRVGDARALEVGARDGEHLVGQVDALDAPCTGSKKREHPAGAGAEVDDEVERAAACGGEHGFLDVGVGIVQRAQPVPLLGDTREILLGGGGAFGLHRAQLVDILLQLGVILPHGDVERVDQIAGLTLDRQAVEHPCPFRQALHQTGGREEFQVPGQGWLALVQHLCQLSDRQLAARQKGQNPGPGALSGGAQLLYERVEADGFHITI